MIDTKWLQRVPRFSGISEKASGFICRNGLLKSYEKGESIFIEGDPCLYFYMVVEGEVKIFKCLESGKEIILNIFRSGEAFGEVSLLDDIELPANATAQKPSRILMLERKHYLEMLEKFPDVTHSIIRDLTMRMRALRQRVETLGESGVEIRIGNLLLSFSEKFGKETESGWFIPISLSRGELASMVGARIETVIRIMSRWGKERMILTEPDGFLIPDPDEFREKISGLD